jgi:hypothetical protein
MDQLTTPANVGEQIVQEADLAAQDVEIETKVGLSDIKGFLQTYRTETVIVAGVLLLLVMLKK